MRPSLTLTGFLALGSIIGLTAGSAQETPTRTRPEEIKKLVMQLSSDNAKLRETATKALMKIGDDALPYLEVAIAEAGNLELKRRAEGLYTEIFDKAPSPSLPEGVVHVKLPPGTVSVLQVNQDGKKRFRITAGKTVIETEKFYIGDRWGACQCEYGSISEPTSAMFVEKYTPLNKLHAGDIFITTPSLVFRWGKDALEERLKALKNRQPRKGDERKVFLGDGSGAIEYEASKDGGLYWVSPNGAKTRVGEGFINEPGATLVQEKHLRIEDLKSGSVYATTRSVLFEFGKNAKKNP